MITTLIRCEVCNTPMFEKKTIERRGVKPPKKPMRWMCEKCMEKTRKRYQERRVLFERKGVLQ